MVVMLKVNYLKINFRIIICINQISIETKIFLQIPSIFNMFPISLIIWIIIMSHICRGFFHILWAIMRMNCGVKITAMRKIFNTQVILQFRKNSGNSRLRHIGTEIMKILRIFNSIGKVHNMTKRCHTVKVHIGKRIFKTRIEACWLAGISKLSCFIWSTQVSG